MTIAAKITPTELGDQVRQRYIGKFFIVKLLSTNGLAYTPGLQDPLQFVIDYEIPRQAGYLPQIFGYETGEVSDYADQGVGLAQKQVIFQHDNGQTGYTFDQVSVQWADGVGQAVALDPARTPGTLEDGTYENLPLSTVTGDGAAGSVGIEVFNGAAVSISLTSRGFGYSAADEVEVSASTLASVGAHDGSGGGLGVIIDSVYTSTNAGSVVLIAPTATPVTLASGNESAVYFNYKNFGYYNTVS
jgi:hypothetical protein